jgi:hypothetical protein
VPRISDYLSTSNVDSRLLFARGAVLVFFSQLGYLLALFLIAFVERWIRVHHPAFGPEFGAGRVVWLVVMFGLTLVTMIAQLYGIKLLAWAVRPWTTHSLPAILCIVLGVVGFVVSVGILTLLVHRI